jgi:hypothetical protein
VPRGHAGHLEVTTEGGAERSCLGEIPESEASLTPQSQRREIDSQNNYVRAPDPKFHFVKDDDG